MHMQYAYTAVDNACFIMQILISEFSFSLSRKWNTSTKCRHIYHSFKTYFRTGPWPWRWNKIAL